MATGQVSARRAINGTFSFIAAAALIALFFAFRRHEAAFRAPHLIVSVRHLPYYAFCSFNRMLAAYAAALLFSLLYGTTASKSKAY
jgi:NitT/TauT family transport system permease protein